MIKKIIGIGGEPATGKSSLMRKFRGNDNRIIKYGTFKAEIHRHLKLIICGIYDNSTFGGTDKLSMAVQPDFLKFLSVIRQSGIWDGFSVLFEGDRLFNASAIEALKDKYDCLFLILKCEANELVFRHEMREDTQSAKFLKGRVTKYKNLISKYDFIKVFPNNNPEEQTAIINFIRENIDA